MYTKEKAYMFSGRTRNKSPEEYEQTSEDFKKFFDNKLDEDFKTMLSNWSSELQPEILMIDMCRVMSIKLGCYAGNAFFPLVKDPKRRTRLLVIMMQEMLEAYDKTEAGHMENGCDHIPLNFKDNYTFVRTTNDK